MRLHFTLPKLQSSFRSSSQAKHEKSISTPFIFVQRQMSVENERLTLDACFGHLQKDEDLKGKSATSSSAPTTSFRSSSQARHEQRMSACMFVQLQMSVENERLTLDTCLGHLHEDGGYQDNGADEKIEDLKGESAALASAPTTKKVVHNLGNDKHCCEPNATMPADGDAMLNEFEEYIEKERRKSQLKLTKDELFKEYQNQELGCLLHGDSVCKICF